ncbi:MAG: Fe-Mn family superoxide dismutase [Candidatus Babeliales bacterium]
MIDYVIQSDLKPKGLTGISDAQIDDHWKLYEGYVKQTNALRNELSDLARQGQGASLAYADRRRRLGFEMNGMVLHELYFGALASHPTPLTDGPLKQALAATWGSYEQWLVDFCTTGKSRGIGWAILFMDPTTKQLVNCFVHDHDMGNIAGFTPLLVMDVWEHAFMLDYGLKRADYINSFFKNINWPIVEKRVK